MKCFYLLFFIYAVQAKENKSIKQGQSFLPVPVILGTVRETNSNVPKCIGMFVTRNVMVTTAKCLFCDRDCDTMVYVNDNDEEKATAYKIKSVRVHEDYDMYPHKNDIGLIFIRGHVPDSVIVELPELGREVNKLTAYSFHGKFAGEQYVFDPEKVTLLTNAKCTFALHNYIPESQICAYSSKNHFLNEHIQGSPLMFYYHGKMYLMGIYAKGNVEYEQGARIGIYQSIEPYINWINVHGKNKKDTSRCRPSKFGVPLAFMKTPRTLEGELEKPTEKSVNAA